MGVQFGYAPPVYGRRAIADAAATVVATDYIIAYTSLSAARTITLPAASAFPAGKRLIVVDESGSASATNTLSLAPNGTDTIDGSNTTQVLINRARGRCELECNGTNGWALLACSVSYTNSLSGNVTLANTGTWYDGPSTAQGAVGRWRAYGQICAYSASAVTDHIYAKLWDGTTVFDSASLNLVAAFMESTMHLSGIISGPAGNIRISANDPDGTTPLLAYNVTALGKDCTITVERIV